MQQRGRNGWWRSERPKLASQITGQREKRVFGCRRIHINNMDWIKGCKQPWCHPNCRAPGKHGRTENKDVRTSTLLWPSSATSEQNQGEWWASGYSRGEHQVWMTGWNKRSFYCGWHHSRRQWYGVLISCGPSSDCHRQWKHGEVHMCYFPEDTGGMHANSKPYIQPGYGYTESTGIASSRSYQTSKGFSEHFFFSWNKPATSLKITYPHWWIPTVITSCFVFTLRLSVSIISVKMLETSTLHFINNAQM